MDTCIRIEDFKNQLVDLINNCGLTIGTAYYIIKDVFKDVEHTYKMSYTMELRDEHLEDKKDIIDFGKDNKLVDEEQEDIITNE